MNKVAGYISAATDEYPMPRTATRGDAEPMEPRVYRDRLKLSLASMKRGESIFTDVASHCVNGDVRNIERALQARFTIKSQEGGTRIWRVK